MLVRSKRVRLSSVTTLILIVALLGCGGGPGGGDTSFITPAVAVQGAVHLEAKGIAAVILPDTFVDRGRVERFELTVSERDGGWVAEITAHSAAGLKALLVELRYNPAILHPVHTDTAVGLVRERDQLRLDMLQMPGVASCGQVIAGYQGHPGVFGDRLLLRVQFERGPAAGLRHTDAPPATDLAAAQLFYESSTGLYWYFSGVGDNNQDGIVSLPDLTPLGQKFGEVASGGGSFAVDDWRDLIDGSRDGAVNIADLAPIGINWQRQLDGYRVYSSTDMADYPPGNTAANGAGAVQEAEVLLSAATGAQDERKRFAFALPAPDPARYYWVRPYDATGDGTPSAARQPGQLDTDPPVWVDDLRIGIQEVIAKDGKVRVMYGAAEDELSPPVDYTVYYASGDSIDFGTAQTLAVTDQSQVVDVTGLQNGTQYAFAVRAKDRAATPNEEQNLVVLTATPLPAVQMPLTISVDTVFDDPVILPAGQTTEVLNGAAITCNNDLLVDGLLHVLDQDLPLTVGGDLIVNGQIALEDSRDDVPDDTEAYNMHIVARSHVSLNGDAALSPEGNLQLVDDPLNLQTSQEGVDDTDTDQNPELYPFNLMPDSPGKGALRIADVRRRTSGTQYYGPNPWRWFVTGNWGQVPTPPRGVNRILLRVFQNNGQIVFQDFSITGPKGRKGKAGTGCTAVGGPGQDAFRLRVHCASKLTLNNVTINLGDGGDGGDATTPPCCDAVATGGKGGQPGKFRFTAGNEISILGTFTLNPGKGGTGGTATAVGDAGQPGCPGDPGCNGTATGGDGATTAFGISVRGNVNGIGNTTLGPARGGDGGAAFATGGDGGATTCECTDGAPGGFGSAEGGKGGDASFGSAAGAGGGGATGGNGGEAVAAGGNGSDGTDCFKAPAGNGGDGGPSDATGGAGGTASGNGTLTNGNQGPATAQGGDGGDGGDGCPPGAGGAGGTANAQGNPATPINGTDGAAGVENPPGCILYLCLDTEAMVPDPSTPGVIPPGFSGTTSVLNADTMQPVGAVQFMWQSAAPGIISWYRGPELQVVFSINNESLQHASLLVSLGAGTWDIDTAKMTGARLGLRSAETMATGDIGYMKTYDGGMVETGSFTLPQVDPIPLGPPFNVDWTVDSFFDVFFTIEVTPQSSVDLETICIIDP